MEVIENKNYQEDQAYLRARKRVEKIRGFYTHLAIYICLNIFISYRRIAEHMEAGKTFEEAFSSMDTYFVWLAWGIGLAFHAFNVFVKNGFLGSQWEERKIQQYMDDETRR